MSDDMSDSWIVYSMVYWVVGWDVGQDVGWLDGITMVCWIWMVRKYV